MDLGATGLSVETREETALGPGAHDGGVGSNSKDGEYGWIRRVFS